MGTAIPFDLSHHRTRRVPVLCTFVLHTPSFGSPAAIPSLSVDTDYFHSFNATIRVKELHSPQRAFQSFLVESFQLRQLPTQTDSPVIPTSSDDSVLPAILPLRSSASTYKYLQQSSNCLAKMQFSKTALLALAPHLLLHTLPPSVPSPSIISMARVLLSWAAWTPLSILVLRPAMFTPSKVVMRSL